MQKKVPGTNPYYKTPAPQPDDQNQVITDQQPSDLPPAPPPKKPKRQKVEKEGPLPPPGTAEKLAPQTKKLADAYVKSLEGYIDVVKRSNMNFFKRFAILFKSNFSHEVMKGTIALSQYSGENFLYGYDDRLKEQTKLLKELAENVKANYELAEKKETRETKKEEEQEVNDEEDRREGNRLTDILKKWFAMSSKERGEKIVGSARDLNIMDLLNPENASHMISAWFSGLVGSVTGAITGVISQGIGALLSKSGLLLASGLAIGITDAWSAGLKSVDWGIDKIPAMITGFIAGTDRIVRSNLISSFGTWKNVAKWGLIGAGIGSVFPVVGTLAGGLIGAVLGLVVSFIGPERIGELIQDITDGLAWMSDLLFGTDYYNKETIEKRIDQVHKSIKANTDEILKNEEQIQKLYVDLQAARAAGDTVKAKSIESEIQNLKDMNAQIQEDINHQQTRINKYKEDLKNEKEGTNGLWDWMVRDLKRMAENDRKNIAAWNEKYQVWKKNVEKQVGETIDSIGESIVQFFKDLGKSIGDIGKSMFKYVKELAKANLPSWLYTAAFEDGMSFGQIGEAVRHDEIGFRAKALAGAAAKPQRSIADIVNKTNTMAPSQKMGDDKKLLDSIDVYIQNNVSQPVVNQNNSSTSVNNVSNHIVTNPRQYDGAFTRNMAR